MKTKIKIKCLEELKTHDDLRTAYLTGREVEWIDNHGKNTPYKVIYV